MLSLFKEVAYFITIPFGLRAINVYFGLYEVGFGVGYVAFFFHLFIGALKDEELRFDILAVFG